MKKALLSLFLLVVISMSGFAQVDKILGKWKTIDDNDGTAKSIVYIFKATNGRYYGKIEKLFKNPEKLCTECDGTNKDKPVLGMLIINNMQEKDGKLTGGTILDPNNGKVYKCNINLETESAEKLNVRGSLDKNGWIGRSQIWIRAN
ncbi:MAG: DUF2147 domain-containing protein [Paludibacter sp.]|nr:DUF2147 domain-containing protein [Paludibacter sp.]